MSSPEKCEADGSETHTAVSVAFLGVFQRDGSRHLRFTYTALSLFDGSRWLSWFNGFGLEQQQNMEVLAVAFLGKGRSHDGLRRCMVELASCLVVE